MPPRPPLQFVRYASAVAASSSSTAAATTSNRVYTDRKSFLFKYYSHLLQKSQLVLVFSHANLSVADTSRIRRAIAAIPIPSPSSSPASSTTTPLVAAPVTGAAAPGATLTIARSGLLGPVCRAVQSPSTSLEPHLLGPTALITCPSLSPVYLSGVLGALQRALKASKRTTENAKQPAFTLVAGVLEGNRLLEPKQIEAVGKLPELDILRAQLVGLIESPARSLLGVLSQAGGGSLVRTLQGLEKDLEAKENPAAAPVSES